MKIKRKKNPQNFWTAPLVDEVSLFRTPIRHFCSVFDSHADDVLVGEITARNRLHTVIPSIGAFATESAEFYQKPEPAEHAEAVSGVGALFYLLFKSIRYRNAPNLKSDEKTQGYTRGHLTLMGMGG